ncbi:MAG: 2'-deoxycytidine 5'-triphosphate deaminase domain-containing protein, partial [Candidatus Nanoarchaeia archaeon]
LFLHTRLLADYNPCFDELHSEYCSEMPVSLWLLLQPLAFNLIIHPGNTLNQLRFFKGDATLSTREVKEEHEKNPLLLTNDNRAVSSIIRDGMQLHLDLSGEQTGGILALKARHNPMPIDLGKINHYNPEDYFQAIYGDKKLIIEKGEHYLFFTKEYLNIPAHLSSELNTYSHVGLNGPLHFAGFIDNGFAGHLVFEIRSDELSNMILDDNMPISRLVFYRTTLPKKLYGKSIGSTYHSQTGLKVAKYFYPIRYE